ncbi:MAG: helix-turn-helix transcriptional regulator [Lachnospiraceae bacterium]|nr:helix-turn-helix transcriptional regulator [Lachnospiraceae bacterium]
MTISYNKLWKLMIDKNLNKGDVCNKTGISSSTMAKMTNGEPVTLQVLEKICRELKCNIDNVMEFKFDADDNSQNENEK